MRRVSSRRVRMRARRVRMRMDWGRLRRASVMMRRVMKARMIDDRRRRRWVRFCLRRACLVRLRRLLRGVVMVFVCVFMVG